MMVRRLSFLLKVFVAPSSWFGVGARVDLPLLLHQVLTPFPLAAHHKYCANTNTKQLQIQIMYLPLYQSTIISSTVKYRTIMNYHQVLINECVFTLQLYLGMWVGSSDSHGLKSTYNGPSTLCSLETPAL